MCSRVDLPQPLRPTMAVKLPRSLSHERTVKDLQGFREASEALQQRHRPHWSVITRCNQQPDNGSDPHHGPSMRSLRRCVSYIDTAAYVLAMS